MGEYVHTDITIGGTVSAEVAAELREVLGADFEEISESGARLYASGQCNYGNADDTEAFCQEHGLPYVLTWASCGAFDSGMHAWRPGMEAAADFEGDEDPAITLAGLKHDAKAGKSLADIIEALSIGDASTLPPYVEEEGEPAEPEPTAGPATPLTPFLCVGYYDDGDRFAETVEAADATAAEALAESSWPSVNWAGFVALRDGVMTVEG